MFMRLRVLLTTTVLLSGFATTAAHANLDLGVDTIELNAERPASVAELRLPFADLAAATGTASHLAIDKFKSQNERAGLFYAANELRSKSDAIQTAAVAEIGGSAQGVDMNVRFYGSLLIFAAGCMMWLGLAVRRHP